jgi:uncharacterized membrane protein (DUF485 family)
MKNKHSKKINWKAVECVIMTLISYFGAVCLGCFITATIEYGVCRSGIMGLVLSVAVMVVSIVAGRNRD